MVGSWGYGATLDGAPASRVGAGGNRFGAWFGHFGAIFDFGVEGVMIGIVFCKIGSFIL